MLQYYNRLIGLAPAIQSGVADDQADLSSRFTVITVEAAKPFQVNGTVNSVSAAKLPYEANFLRDYFGELQNVR
jgi:hypothetical protein